MEKRQKQSKEIIDWLYFKASMAVCDWLGLCFVRLEEGKTRTCKQNREIP